LPAPLRRLSRAEYLLTVQDLFPGAALPNLALPPDPDVLGFENRANRLNPTDQLVYAQEESAGKIAAAVAAGLATALSCQVAAPCAAALVTSFGQRAFRRPLTADEEKTFSDFFITQAAAGGVPAAVEATVAAMLQSPQFVYRIEVGGAGGAAASAARKPTPYEVASRLSYLLWASMPDDALFEAARAGKLETAEEREAQARRMLGDPKARRQIVDFHRQWLEFDRMLGEDKSLTRYPHYTPALRAAVREEADRFVGDVVFGPGGDGKLRTLLTSVVTFVNPELARLYGVPAPASGWTRASLPPAERAGVLTRANYQAGHSHDEKGSAPLRALPIIKRLLCQDIPPPPANFEPRSSRTGAAPQTDRQALEQQTSETGCQGCHRTINPFGFAFEHYDAVGGFRRTDNGLPVNASGDLTPLGLDITGTFRDATELSAKLAGSASVTACATLQLYQSAMGRDLEKVDECRLGAVRRVLANAQGDLREALVALAVAPEMVSLPAAAP
jgi:hypothetical protein